MSSSVEVRDTWNDDYFSRHFVRDPRNPIDKVRCLEGTLAIWLSTDTNWRIETDTTWAGYLNVAYPNPGWDSRK